MGIVIDKILGEVLFHSHVKSGSSNPASGSDGDWFLNTTNHTLLFWYDNQWQTLHSFSVPDNILMESGDYILMESGDKILLES